MRASQPLAPPSYGYTPLPSYPAAARGQRVEAPNGLGARETGPNRLDERATKSRERLNLPRFFKFAVRIEGVLGVGDKDGPGDDPDVDGAEADPQIHLAPRRTLRSGRRTEGRRDLPAEDVGGA